MRAMCQREQEVAMLHCWLWKCIFLSESWVSKLRGWLLVTGGECAVDDLSWSSDSKTRMRQFVLWVSSCLEQGWVGEVVSEI